MTASEIKMQHSMREVLYRYGVKIDRAGFCKCIYHDERTASMKVYERSFYSYCCGKSGDIFDVVQYFENVDFKGAMRSLGGDEKPSALAKIKMYHAKKAQEKRARDMKIILDGMRESAAKVHAMREAIRSLPFGDDLQAELIKHFAQAEYQADYWLDRWDDFRRQKY